jgi:hypothetical protein
MRPLWVVPGFSSMTANGPACVKTQKRSNVIVLKLDWISSEVSIR